jgi:SAM-dependent methyltransferase
MIEIAKQKLPAAAFQQGSGENMPYEDGSVDVAIATGIMHHADNPSAVIKEMFRVARKGILISDHNNYAFGGSVMQRLRMGLKVCGLLEAVTFVRNGFKKQGYSEGDGWWYPYSLFDDYAQIARLAEQVFIIPTRRPTGDLGNIVFAQSHFAIVALKHEANPGH